MKTPGNMKDITVEDFAFVDINDMFAKIREYLIIYPVELYFTRITIDKSFGEWHIYCERWKESVD